MKSLKNKIITAITAGYMLVAPACNGPSIRVDDRVETKTEVVLEKNDAVVDNVDLDNMSIDNKINDSTYFMNSSSKSETVKKGEQVTIIAKYESAVNAKSETIKFTVPAIDESIKPDDFRDYKIGTGRNLIQIINGNDTTNVHGILVSYSTLQLYNVIVQNKNKIKAYSFSNYGVCDERIYHFITQRKGTDFDSNWDYGSELETIMMMQYRASPWLVAEYSLKNGEGYQMVKLGDKNYQHEHSINKAQITAQFEYLSQITKYCKMAFEMKELKESKAKKELDLKIEKSYNDKKQSIDEATKW
ncbi:MAG: hypothetical protein ACP5N1_01230 [Candidatus Woesearchaeota archaeon]